jgi:hypothetical protein
VSGVTWKEIRTADPPVFPNTDAGLPTVGWLHLVFRAVSAVMLIRATHIGVWGVWVQLRDSYGCESSPGDALGLPSSAPPVEAQERPDDSVHDVASVRCDWRMEILPRVPDTCRKNNAVPPPPCRRQGGEYSCYSFLTSALDGGGWSASRPGRALLPVRIGQEARCASELVWTQKLEEKFFACAGDRTPVVQSVVRHCTDRDIQLPVGRVK